MKFPVLVATVLLTCAVGLSAPERRPIAEVSVDAFTTDTQFSPPNVGDDHMALCWWIPLEFWMAIDAREESMSKEDKQEMLDSFSGVTIVAVVQADITDSAAFKFYSNAEVLQNLQVSRKGPEGAITKIKVIEEVGEDLQAFLKVFKPILTSAMGKMGENFHFFVFEDGKKNGNRLLDPYLRGELQVKLQKRDGQVMKGQIDQQINSLFLPRKCPNGRDAHVSWGFCPWTGKALDGAAKEE